MGKARPRSMELQDIVNREKAWLLGGTRLIGCVLARAISTPTVHFLDGFLKMLTLVRTQDCADRLVRLGARFFILRPELHRQVAIALSALIDDGPELLLLLWIEV